ncbi:MAG: right-handed parallel beta-helix repeat-containing protein [Nanoarchaeota archaeon]|nr:right-handed parallel beta-helix repeat-containing protein [Nanoarchaeota archaeon]
MIKYLMRFIFFVIFVIFVFIIQVNSINISSCAATYTISSPGTYEVTGNLVTTTNCIRIESDNVTLNCQGYVLDGDVSGLDYAISDNFNSPSNVTIKNCHVKDFWHGFYFFGSNISIYNSSSSLNIFNGFNFGGGSNLLIDNFSSYSNGFNNFELSSISSGIFNNILLNDSSDGYGARILNSNNIIFNNSKVSDNDEYGLLLFSVLNSSFYNTIVSLGQGSGIYLENSHNNLFENMSLIDNLGVSGADSYSGGFNLRNSNSNILRNSNISNNKKFNLIPLNFYFRNTSGNIVYGNFIDNGSTILAYNWSENSDFFSYNGVGNFYSDFVCIENSTGNDGIYEYEICTNQSFYTINSTYGIVDDSPLFSLIKTIYIPSMDGSDSSFLPFGNLFFPLIFIVGLFLLF